MSIQPGDKLPELPAPEINVTRIRQVMDVMDDINPVHIDEELVRQLGLRGLVNQGPANLAYITNMLTRWAGNPDAIRRFQIRFHDMVVPGDILTAGGHVTSVREDGLAECAVWLRQRDGTVMLAGTATLVPPEA